LPHLRTPGETRTPICRFKRPPLCR